MTSAPGSPEGRDRDSADYSYILQRHGTLDLVPFPTNNENDPCKFREAW